MKIYKQHQIQNLNTYINIFFKEDFKGKFNINTIAYITSNPITIRTPFYDQTKPIDKLLIQIIKNELL